MVESLVDAACVILILILTCTYDYLGKRFGLVGWFARFNGESFNF